MAIVTELICMRILNLIGINISQVLTPGRERAIYILLSKIVQLILVLLSLTVFKRKESPLTAKKIISILPCQLLSIFFCDEMFKANQGLGKVLSGKNLIILVGIFYINIVIIVYVEVMKAEQEERLEANTAKQQLECQRDYYSQLYKEQEDTRKLWHDMSKYIYAMEAMVVSGNEEVATSVFSDAKRAFETLGSIVDIGNAELNIILNYQIQKARQFNIPIDLDAWVPEKLPYSFSDLCIIIGNTIDNAMEASLAIPECKRHISVQMKQRNQLFLYEVSNEYEEGKKCSINEQTLYHGYGLKNVSTIARKYGGTCRTHGANMLYTVTVYLGCSTES